MFSGMTRLLRFVAVAVLVGGATAVLSSCSSEPGPIVTETPWPTAVVSAPPSSSPTPTVTPEEELLAQIPEAARGEDFASASNFVGFYVDLYPGLFERDPRTSLFEWLSMNDCVFCESNLESSGETARVGAHSEGGVFTLDDAIGQGGQRDDGFTYVGRRFSVTDTVTYLADGSEYKTVPGGTGIAALKLKYSDGCWRVYEAEFRYDDE